MAMSVGTAAIAVSGTGTITVTGSGMAKDIADAMAASGGSVYVRVAEMLAAIADPAVRASVLPGIGPFYARLAQDYALGAVNHITTNAHAVIGTGTSPGRMPTSTTPGTPLTAPVSNVELAIQ